MSATVVFDERVAVVTGAGSGLGRAYAIEMAHRGAHVVVNDIDGASADAVAREIATSGGTAIAAPASVATREGGASIIAAAVEHFGGVDIVVNNAGVLRDRTFAKLDLAELQETLAVHLLGAVHVTQPAFVLMKECGYGRVVNTTSAVGIWGNFGQASYAAAKMGLIGLTNVLAIEGARHDIRVNAVAPIARTPGAAGLDIFDAFGDAVSPDHVAPLVCYLASERCDLTQHLFTAGGGYFARVFTGVTGGWFAGSGGPPSVEEIEDHLAQILAADGSRIPGALLDEGAHLLQLLGDAADA